MRSFTASVPAITARMVTDPAAGMVLDQKGNLYGTTEVGGAYGAGVVFRLTPEGKETVLYSFCAHNNCADGYGSVAGLVFDQEGNIYGTTEYGGAGSGGCYGGCGVVFKLTPERKYTVLYSFCAQSGCTDGANPLAGLVFDQKGNLYGTTSERRDLTTMTATTDAASYSSSPPRTRRQFSTASARRTAPMGTFPWQV